MTISILTLFPEMFSGPFDFSIIKRAKEKKAVTINIVNIREFATDRYKSVDDHPYGGGVGMILRVDVIDRTIERQKVKGKRKKEKIILLDPRGGSFTQKKAREYAKLDHLILICGHYEGVDERVKSLVDESVSIGDYVLTGGEIPSMVITDSIVRLLPGVLKKEAIQSESFSLEIVPRSGIPLRGRNLNLKKPFLEYPQYTRPPEYKRMRVPKILLSGNHKKIAEWKKQYTTPARRG